MKSVKKLVLCFLICCTFVLIYSCSNSTTTPVTPPTTITVSGKALDTYGNPIGGASTVVIGNQSTTTAGDGSFTINNVTTPYDVWVLNPTSGVFGVKGLTITNPYIPASTSPGNTQSLLVTIPLVPTGSRATVIFQDTVTGKVSGFGQVPANSQNAVLSIGGINGQSVAGKLYLIQYNISGGVVSSYTGYAEMQAVFIVGASPTFTFNSIGGGLGASTVSGTVNSSGSTNLKAQLYINFSGKNNLVHKGGFIEQVAIIGTTGTYNFNVPTGTSSTANLNIVAITPDTIGIYPNIKQRMLTVQAGATGSIVSIDSSASILTPGNGATNVDSTSLFSYSSGSGNSVHVIHINPIGSGYTYQVLVKGTSFNFPNLSAYGYNFASGQQYSYMVSNTLDIASTNDYCAQLFDLNPAIKGTVQSGTFTFQAR